MEGSTTGKPRELPVDAHLRLRRGWDQPATDKGLKFLAIKPVVLVISVCGFGLTVNCRLWTVDCQLVLTADHQVQATAFADGTRVWVNFGEKPFALKGVAILGPKSWKVVYPAGVKGGE